MQFSARLTRIHARQLAWSGWLALTLASAAAAGRAQQDFTWTRAQIEAGAHSAGETPQGPPAEVHAIAGRGPYQVLAAIHRPADSPEWMTLWSGQDGQFRLARQIAGADAPGVGRLLPPRRFRFAGEIFIHVQLAIAGTGALHEDHLLRITPAGGLEPVEFEEPAAWYAPRLAPGEGVWKGAAYIFNDDDLRFEFHIWRQGDANCCPTAGGVTGTMKAVPGGAGWRIVVDQFNREAPVVVDPDGRN